MNSIQAELRTPPLPLIAFIGCSELHKDVGSYFNQTLCPPFFSVGLAEPNEQLLTRLFGTPKQQKPINPTPDGILKASWFQKQRHRRAAVAVACVTRSDVEGDPTSWLRMLSGLRTIRSTSTHKNVQLLVVVVQDGPLTELPQDRLTGLCSNLNIEQRYIRLVSRRVADASLSAEERRQIQDVELRPLGQLLTEAAAAYYTAAADRLRQRQLDITAALGNCPPEISVATAFKIAVFAEFRQDWLTAVSSYQAAAAALQGVPLGRPVSCQRHAEVTAVAEVVHFKAMMLLLHQQRYAEAVQQLRGHLAVFGPLPDGLPLPAAAAHHGWLSRQYQTAAEMVAMSRMDQATLQAHRDVSPCYLLMSAVELAATRKALVRQLAESRAGAPVPFDSSSVRKGRYLGQMESKRGGEGPIKHCDLSDSESVQYLEAEERRINHSQLLLELLQQTQTLLQTQTDQSTPPVGITAVNASRISKGAADRLQARLAWLTAEQHIDAHNLTAARKMLLQTVYIYRRDGWDALLIPSLTLLRDVCQRLKLDKEALLHSLELASLISSSAPNSSSSTALCPDHQQAAAALAGLLAGPAGRKGGIMKPSGSDRASVDSSVRSSLTTGDDALQSQQQQQHQQQAVDAFPESTSPAKVASTPAGDGWCYTVRHLDLTSALQQLPPTDDGVCKSTRVADVLQQYHQQYSGWWRIITLVGGFAAHTPDTDQVKVCIALQNHAPVPLPLMKATISLIDAQGSWVQDLTVLGPAAAQQRPQHAGLAAVGDASAPVQGHLALAHEHVAGNLSGQVLDSSATRSTRLQPGSWQLLNASIRPRCVGSVAVGDVLLQLSEHCSVNFLLSSLPSGRAALGHAGLVCADSPFSVRQGVKQGAWVTKVQHVGALPEVKVLVPQLMLVGEFVPVVVNVQFKAAQEASYLDVSLQSSMGATPGQVTLLAASQDGKLQTLNTEGHSLHLPSMTAGSCYNQQLWVRSAFAINCKLLVQLNCPAQVTQSVALQFAEPFEHVTRCSGEVNMHTLVGPSDEFAVMRQGGGSAGSSGGVPLVIGQVALAQVLIQAVHDVELQVMEAQLELQKDVGVQVMNNVADQLVGQTVNMHKGSVHCLLLQLMPLAAVSEPTSLGTLQLRWKRRRPAVIGGTEQDLQASSSSSAVGVDGAGTMFRVAAPSEYVTTSLELPRVTVQESLLSVKVIAPRSAVAGIAFQFTTQVTNMTPQPQEVSISLQEVQGFVSAGEKQQNISLSPRDSSSLNWTLLAHVSGQLLLPSIKVSSARFSCHVMTQQGHIHIMPF